MSAPPTPAWFVTGTDTGIGKTFVACALLHALRSHGHRALGMKPVAAGIELVGGREANEDVEALIGASGTIAPREFVNPYLLREAVSPHIAAAHQGVSIELAVIRQAFERLAAQADAVVVEGCGGFVVPLGPRLDTADLAVALGLPVILVVGMRLGCLNHSLLTQEAIRQRGLRLAGWVANTIDPAMQCLEQNLATLRERIAAPLLGVIPHAPDRDPARFADRLQLPG